MDADKQEFTQIEAFNLCQALYEAMCYLSDLGVKRPVFPRTATGAIESKPGFHLAFKMYSEATDKDWLARRPDYESSDENGLLKG